MEIISDISVLRTRLKPEQSIGFVPTMGNLHEGHLSLVTITQQHARCTIVSLFVNRLQFSPNEDFDRYPRTLQNDFALLKEAGVDIVFLPDEKTIYPSPQTFQLLLPALADTLEGAFRPGFFRGVTTVVLKLFNIVQPHVAVFGKKDYQQLHLVRDMVEQLNLPITILAGETIRLKNGLAFSSRNSYLTSLERTEASQLYQSLNQIKHAITAGERNLTLLEETAKQQLNQRNWRVDYLSVMQRNTLLPATPQDTELVILGAAWLGTTRLIDNLEVTLPQPLG
ncbi:MAG: pantoate--beta-alanine ligase [Nitrosomonas sp.]